MGHMGIPYVYDYTFPEVLNDNHFSWPRFVICLRGRENILFIFLTRHTYVRVDVCVCVCTFIYIHEDSLSCTVHPSSDVAI